MRGQQGQALVGVLVVMTVVLLLAGGVAIGASALFLSERRSTLVADDLMVQDGVSFGVAHVAKNGLQCASRTNGSITASQSHFRNPLPASAPGTVSQIAYEYCRQVAPVEAGSIRRATPTQAGPNCWSSGQPPATGNVWVFASVFLTMNTSSADIFVTGPNGCSQMATAKCSTTVTTFVNDHFPLWQTAALQCDNVSSSDRVYFTSAAPIGHYFMAERESSSNGAYFLLTSEVGQHVEESVVQAQSGRLSLVTEEPLA